MRLAVRFAAPLVALGVSASAQAADFSYSNSFLNVVGNLASVVGAGSGLSFSTPNASKAYVTNLSNGNGYNSFSIGPTVGSYLTVLGGGEATFSTGLTNIFSFYWGTIDTTAGWNKITFKNGNTVVASFDGSLLGSFSLNHYAAYLTEFVTASAFDKVVLTANQNSFEVANVASVPGPVAGAGLPILLALTGFAAWRRRQAAA